MSDFDFGSYQVDGHNYLFTTGNLTGSEAVLAVTDEKNGVHYVSEEVEAASDDLMPTSTVPDGYGLPDRIVRDVDVSRMDDIASYIKQQDKKSLEISLARLGDEILGPDSRRSKPEGPSSRKARKKMSMYDHQKAPSDFP